MRSIRYQIGSIRKDLAVNFQTALVADLESSLDNEVLEFAAKKQRILVSHDRRTMPTHFANFIVENISYGVLIIPQNVLILEAIDNLILIWAVSEVDEWINRIVYLPL